MTRECLISVSMTCGSFLSLGLDLGSAPPSGRRTLAVSGLWPQIFNAKQLEDMGMSVSLVEPLVVS